MGQVSLDMTLMKTLQTITDKPAIIFPLRYIKAQTAIAIETREMQAIKVNSFTVHSPSRLPPKVSSSLCVEQNDDGHDHNNNQ